MVACSLQAATPVKQHKRRRSTPASTPLARKAKTAALAGSTGARGARASRRKVSRAPVRSYQQAPTPERYKEIQEALASKGYFKGEATGQWGPDSDAALKRFQADQNLMPDGKINSLSLIALGLGPKRLTAKSEALPQSQQAPSVSSPLTALPGATGSSAPQVTPPPPTTVPAGAPAAPTQ